MTKNVPTHQKKIRYPSIMAIDYKHIGLTHYIQTRQERTVACSKTITQKWSNHSNNKYGNVYMPLHRKREGSFYRQVQYSYPLTFTQLSLASEANKFVMMI